MSQVNQTRSILADTVLRKPNIRAPQVVSCDVRPSNEITDDPSKSRLFFSSQGSLVDPRVRASNEHRRPSSRPLMPLPSSLAFPIRKGGHVGLGAAVERCSSNSLYIFLKEWPRLPFTARIERPLLRRGGSASKKGTWPLFPHPFFLSGMI